MKTSELLEKQEELHSDLKHYVYTEGKTFPLLSHPLMTICPYWERMNADINASYEQKLKDLKKCKENFNWWRYMFIYERPYRLQAFMDIADQLIDQDYWEIAGWLWQDTENQWQNLSEWQEVLTSDRALSQFFMTPDERAYFQSLPDEFEIYRGCFEGINEDGLSWTFNKGIAEMFCGHKHFKRNDDWQPLILSQTVRTKDIFAIKLGRKESEVILKV